MLKRKMTATCDGLCGTTVEVPEEHHLQPWIWLAGRGWRTDQVPQIFCSNCKGRQP